MDCERYSQEIPEYLRGDLSKDEIAELETHVQACSRCQEEVEDLRWFLTGVRNNAMAISEGHLSSRLLYESVDEPSALEPDVMARLKDHLNTCESCRRDRDRINELITLELHPFGERSTSTARRVRWFRGGRFKTALAGVSVAIVAVALIWSFFSARGGPDHFPTTSPDYDVALVSSGAGYDVVDVPLQEPVRGESEQSPVVSLKELDVEKIVLRIEVDLFEGEDSSVTVMIHNATGHTVWTSRLEKVQRATGTILLLVDKSTFAPGRYTVEVFDRFDASIGQGTIDI